MIDYIPFFNYISSAQTLFPSYKDKKAFVDLFYQYRIPDQIYPFSCKLFNETKFIVDLGNEMGREIFVNGFIEADIVNFLLKNVQPKDGFIDGGAHMGFYSTLMSDLVGNDGRVLAIEPNPNILDIFKMNHRHTQNVELVEKAISENGQMQKLYTFGNSLSPYSSLHSKSRIISKNEIKPVQTLDVESITLAKLIETISQKIEPTSRIWIKLDIEGSELMVISASMDALKDRNCTLIFEGGLNSNDDHAIFDLLVANQYDIFLCQHYDLCQISDKSKLPVERWCNFIAIRRTCRPMHKSSWLLRGRLQR